MSNLRTLLVDADGLAYRSCCRNQTSVEWDSEGPAVSADLEATKSDIKSYLQSLQSELFADRLVLCLSDPSRRYFRHTLLPSYKQHRKESEKPVHLEAIRKWLEETYSTKTKPALEADDVLGILATHPTILKGDRVVVSVDKDLRQIPGSLYNPQKADLGIQQVNPDAADLWFYSQVLIGDTCDGFKGCPGIGPKKAGKILEKAEYGNFWEEVLWAFSDKGLTESDALVQARVARILRHTDWDFEKQEPILWTPST